jgi:FkbM family methyltransferase
MIIDLVSLKNKYDLKINGVIHIGAHFGQEFKTYINLQIKNLIFFEPIPNTFEILKNNIGDQAILVNTALGNFDGEVEMFVEQANQGQSSSVLEPVLHLNQYPHIKFTNKIKVPITKLDNYISKNIDNVGNYNMINIDVQGYELEVFKGSEKTLNNVDYIMTEINRDEVYKNCSKIDEMDLYLSEFRFKRVETNWAGGTWGDAFYIKEK